MVLIPSEQAPLNRNGDELDKIRDLERKFSFAIKNDHISALTAVLINKDLHFAVYTASSLPTLVSIIEGLWLRVGPSIGLDLTAVDRFARGHAERYHAQLVSAIAEKDSTAAREAVGSDIKTSVEYIIATGALASA